MPSHVGDDGRQASDSGRVQHVGSYTFDLDNSLGKGSFAEVFKGNHTQTGQEVAIKRIHQNRVKGASNQKLLESEISIMQEVKHVNIVALLGHFRTDAHIYLVMEYCNGGDLNDFIVKYFPMGEGTIAYIASHIASALHYLHKHHIVHRDLKPQNILVHYPARVKDGETGTGSSTVPSKNEGDSRLRHDHRQGDPIIKIADFGFARHLEADMAETFCGSPLYMAPEVLFGGAYDSRSDLWSVGGILFQCLTKRPPFRAKSIEALKTMLSKPTAEKLKLAPETSGALRDLLGGLLRVSPDQRLSFDAFFSHPFLDLQLAPTVYATDDGSILLASNRSEKNSSRSRAEEEQATRAQGSAQAAEPASAREGMHAADNAMLVDDPHGAAQRQRSDRGRRGGVPYGDVPASPSPSNSLLEDDSDGSDPSLIHVSDTAPTQPFLPRLLHTAMQFVPRVRARGGAGVALNGEGNVYDAMATAESTLGADYSFIVVDKEHVEINKLADVLEYDGPHGRVYRDAERNDGQRNIRGIQATSPNGVSSASKQDVDAFVTAIQRTIRPASAIMLVAQHHLTSDRMDHQTGMLVSVAPVGMGGRPARAVLKIEALKLYNKALMLLRAGMTDLRARINANGSLVHASSAKTAVQQLRKRFNDCLAAVEKLRGELPDGMELSSYQGAVVVGPEELLYTYALDLCREAVDWETKGDVVRSELLYSRILVLFNILLQTAEADDAKILQGYADITRKRLEAVMHQGKGGETSAGKSGIDGAVDLANVAHVGGGDDRDSAERVVPVYPTKHHQLAGHGTSRDDRERHPTSTPHNAWDGHAPYSGDHRGFTQTNTHDHATASPPHGPPPTQQYPHDDELMSLEAERSRLQQQRAALQHQLADVDAALQYPMEPQQRQYAEQDRGRVYMNLEDCGNQEDLLNRRIRDSHNRLRLGAAEYARIARDMSTSTSGSSNGSGGASHHADAHEHHHPDGRRGVGIPHLHHSPPDGVDRVQSRDHHAPPPSHGHPPDHKHEYPHPVTANASTPAREQDANTPPRHAHPQDHLPPHMHRAVETPPMTSSAPRSPPGEQSGRTNNALRYGRRLSPPAQHRLSPSNVPYGNSPLPRHPTIREELHEGISHNYHTGEGNVDGADFHAHGTTHGTSQPIAIGRPRVEGYGGYDSYGQRAHDNSDNKHTNTGLHGTYYGYNSPTDGRNAPTDQTHQAYYVAHQHPNVSSGHTAVDAPSRPEHLLATQRGESAALPFLPDARGHPHAAPGPHAPPWQADADHHRHGLPRQSPPQGTALSRPPYGPAHHGSPPSSYSHTPMQRHSPPQQHVATPAGTRPPTNPPQPPQAGSDSAYVRTDTHAPVHNTTGAFVDHVGEATMTRPQDGGDNAARIPRTSPLRHEGAVVAREHPDVHARPGNSGGPTPRQPTSVGFSPPPHSAQHGADYGVSFPASQQYIRNGQLHCGSGFTQDYHNDSCERRASLPENYPHHGLDQTTLAASQETAVSSHQRQQHNYQQYHQQPLQNEPYQYQQHQIEEQQRQQPLDKSVASEQLALLQAQVQELQMQISNSQTGATIKQG